MADCESKCSHLTLGQLFLSHIRLTCIVLPTVFVGLPLIPLASGQFATFCSGEDSVYIPSEAHPSSILPMLEGQFVDISNRVSDHVLTHLKQMAKQGMGAPNLRDQ